MTDEAKLRTAKKSSRFSLAILVFFAITGLLLFELFNFSIGAFRIAGGILLIATALDMLYPKEGGDSTSDPTRDISLIPMAIPFISGPGTIVTTVVLVSNAQNLANGDLGTALIAYGGIFLGIGILITISYQVMIHSERLFSLMREEGRKAVTKLMGLIVLSIAIQFIINGIGDILPMYLNIIEGII